MIAIAMLAALGQAIQAAEVYAAIAGGTLLAAMAILAACLLTPLGWEPRRLRKALHEPPPRCFVCGAGAGTDLEPIGTGALLACRDIEACDQRRRERAATEGAGQ